MKKEYTNGEVTITWQPDKCIHSALCANELPNVFKPKEKPWVDTSQASTEQIISQVKKCPSLALGYYLNEQPQNPNITSKSNNNMKCKVIENGPLMISGDFSVEHKDGSTENKSGGAFCRCGHSSNKPFCDGTHKNQAFE